MDWSIGLSQIHFRRQSQPEVLIPNPRADDRNAAIVAIATQIRSRLATDRRLHQPRQRLFVARYFGLTAFGRIHTWIAQLHELIGSARRKQSRDILWEAAFSQQVRCAVKHICFSGSSRAGSLRYRAKFLRRVQPESQRSYNVAGPIKDRS